MPPYLTHKANTYYYRQAVPAELRAILGKREIKKSLRLSSSAWVKNALAKRIISLVWRSCFTSRPKDLMRSRSALGTPSRMPASISYLLTHSCSVIAAQPILGAIGSTAAHCEGKSLGASCTNRTACSLTSCSYLFDLFMAHSLR